MTCDSVDLPEPFGPMMACTSPLFTVSDSPWRISRSSTRTCRSLTSSSGITIFRFFRLLFPRPEERRRRVSKDERPQSLLSSFETAATRPPQDEELSNRTFQRDRDQLLRLDRALHRQFLQHILDEAVHNQADRFLLAQRTLPA